MKTPLRALMGIALVLASGRQPSSVSTTYFAAKGKQRELPLAVLRAGNGRATPNPSELKVFADDATWASKVDNFMIAAGVDGDGVQSALKRVRHLSWAAGRTLRSKSVVLLAFADDVQYDEGVERLCRLTRAVMAATNHTTEAHLVLVADGFELEATTREDVESLLDRAGWRSFTTIEIPEFEGFSSVINQAMEVISNSSIVAVLSTSVAMLPVSTTETSTQATSTSSGENNVEDNQTEMGAGHSPCDIFVAYEQMTINSAVTSAASPNSMIPRHRFHAKTEQASSSWQDIRDDSTGEVDTPYDPYGRGLYGARRCDEGQGLLVTASPLLLAKDQRPNHHKNNEKHFIDENEEAPGGRFATSRQQASQASWQTISASMSNVAPLPILVFDTETFAALGEFDERFSFQGGIAEWISRATLNNKGQSRGIGTDIYGHGYHKGPSDASPGGQGAEIGLKASSKSFCSARTVEHVHEKELDRLFIGQWVDDAPRAGNAFHGTGSNPNQDAQIKNPPGVDLLHGNEQDDEVEERIHLRKIRQHEEKDRKTIGHDAIDQWSRMPLTRLETLVQADADLFFLPLLLQQQSPGEANNHFKRFASVDDSIAFHSSWMERVPDERLVAEALIRREHFPVAVVVVVHDEISLLRSALEEVAIVVEHILVVVSLTPWNGDAGDVSPTLELLDQLLMDVDSATYGKLRVELGSWSTESEQREYGNAVIREDPRKFLRIVVMDADEFWHPVELTKALVEAARHPQLTHCRAEQDTIWVSMRSMVLPLPGVLNPVWLVDPRRCVWVIFEKEYREVLTRFARGTGLDASDRFDDGRDLKRILILALPVEMFESQSLETLFKSTLRLHLRRKSWAEFREPICKTEGSDGSVHAWLLGRDIGVIHRLSYHEERHELKHLQLRSISGNLAVLDASWNSHDTPRPSWLTKGTNESTFGSSVLGSNVVWTKLREVTSSRLHCANPPCSGGRHIHPEWADLAEEMSRVQGAVVVRRPDLTDLQENLAPATSLNFVETLKSYFGIFQKSLFPTRTMIAGSRLAEVQKNRRFVDAVANGDSAAARFLSVYYGEFEVPKRGSDGYEDPPTVVGMADAYINKLGHVWNKKDYVVPKSCAAETSGPRSRVYFPSGADSYDMVFIMTQHWGEEYFHFVVEALPRITVMLDILRENVDIKIAVRAPDPYRKSSTLYMHQFLKLLGIEKNRVIFIHNEIHADLAILPNSVPCGKPDTQAVNMLRHSLLQAMYPSTGGIPLPVARPTIVLIVRTNGRWLLNNDEVREALQREFPSFDVVEFFGTGHIVQQLKMFATASLIVGPHGAGLSNMMVSPLHTPVLEIGPPDCSACFLHLAVKLQHVYARHLVVNDDWRLPCLSPYEPSVGEVLLLVRDLFEGKKQADAADPPKITGVEPVDYSSARLRSA